MMVHVISPNSAGSALGFAAGCVQNTSTKADSYTILQQLASIDLKQQLLLLHVFP